MQDAIGAFIDDTATTDGSGKPGPIAIDGGSRTDIGSTGEPEIISGFEYIEPETIRVEPAAAGSGGNGRSTGGKRGRPRKQDSAEKVTEVQSSLVDITGVLLSIHQMGAALLSIKELELEPSEAKKLADGIKQVAKHYPVNIDPKKLAWFNLGIVVTELYGTRLMAYSMRSKMEQSNRPQPVNKVAPIRNAAPAPPKNAAEMSPSEIWNEPPIDRAVF